MALRENLKTSDVNVVYNPEGGSHTGPLSDLIWKQKELSIYLQLRDPELFILQSSENCSTYVDRISTFSPRLPELIYVVDEVGLYIRCFDIFSSTIKDDYFRQKLLPNHRSLCWIYGLDHQFKLR